MVTLCAQHCDVQDLVSLVLSFADTRSHRLFPTFFQHIGDLLQAQPRFADCALEILDGQARSSDMCLGPHCQCASIEEAYRRRWLQGQGPRSFVRLLLVGVREDR